MANSHKDRGERDQSARKMWDGREDLEIQKRIETGDVRRGLEGDRWYGWNTFRGT